LNLTLSPHVVLRAFEADYLRTQLPNSTTNVQNNITLGAGIALASTRLRKTPTHMSVPRRARLWARLWPGSGQHVCAGNLRVKHRLLQISEYRLKSRHKPFIKPE